MEVFITQENRLYRQSCGKTFEQGIRFCLFREKHREFILVELAG